jgi:hypothetical protein
MRRNFGSATRATALTLTVCGLLLISGNAFGGGGACPSGANYLSEPTDALVTLATLGVTNCYYVSQQAGASDSNSGTTESAPWLHAPGMTGCSANCLAFANANGPGPGQGIIFRGGDTWHYGNGTSSSTGLPWTCGYNGSSCSGTSGSPVYIGFDLTWYAGASWARPIFNMDNPLTTSAVASCAYDDGAITGALYHEPVFLSHDNYLIFDNFEFEGFCWDKTAGTFFYGVGNNIQFLRNYFHGWTYVNETGASCSGGFCDTNHMVTGSGSSGIFAFNTFDGVDSSPNSGFALYAQNAYDIHGNVFRHLTNAVVSGPIHTFHDNLAEYLNPSYDGASHGNVFEFLSSYPGNNFYYNNVVRHITASGDPGFWIALGTSSSTDSVYNNVIYDFNGDSQGASNCFLVAQTATGSVTNNVNFWNNTFHTCVVQTNGNSVTPPYSGMLNFESNHFIGYAAQNLASVWTNGSGTYQGSATAVDLGGQIYQSEATANRQGYVPSNNYAPTLATNSTVGLGSNLTSSCSETSALCSDTTLGNTRTPNPRPGSGAWDAGAYLFIATRPLSPTNVTATVH